ncbi:MAG: hypothetical protein ABI697_11120 [Devosia sp.]
MTDTIDDVLKGYIDRPTLARQFRTSVRTIIRYEGQADGLPSVMIGGKKFYRLVAVTDWLMKRERRPNQRRRA